MEFHNTFYKRYSNTNGKYSKLVDSVGLYFTSSLTRLKMTANQTFQSNPAKKIFTYVGLWCNT